MRGLDIGLLLLRVGAGSLIFFLHGFPKLAGFSEKAALFPDPLGMGSAVTLTIAIFAEAFCSIAVIAGLFTRYAAMPLMLTMLVAALIHHAPDPWAKKELAALFGVCFLTLMFTGAGRFSLDAMLGKK